jgi:hypothetical protein
MGVRGWWVFLWHADILVHSHVFHTKQKIHKEREYSDLTTDVFVLRPVVLLGRNLFFISGKMPSHPTSIFSV